MPYCRYCGSQIGEQDIKCAVCGAETGVMSPKKVYCRWCGEMIEEDCVVCPKCGKQVKELRVSTNNNIFYERHDTNVIHRGKEISELPLS